MSVNSAYHINLTNKDEDTSNPSDNQFFRIRSTEYATNLWQKITQFLTFATKVFRKKYKQKWPEKL